MFYAKLWRLISKFKKANVSGLTASHSTDTEIKIVATKNQPHTKSHT